mgnify:FL=1
MARRCKCDCGNEVIVRSDCLKSGNTKSCGCYDKERIKETHTKHGKTDTAAYRVWAGMIDRCYNPNNQAYNYYGGRGIKVYRPWWKFSKFYRDMGDKPKEMTLERVNNNKGYYPNNCKWATRQEQMQNIRAKGYFWDKRRKKWLAQITVNYQNIFLGYFHKEKNAKRAYLVAKKKYHKRKS